MKTLPPRSYESFAYGKAVIGSNIGGIPEHIEEGRDGFLFRYGDSADLAAKINAMYADPQRAIEMGKRARQKAESLYSLENHMERLMEVYEGLVRC